MKIRLCFVLLLLLVMFSCAKKSARPEELKPGSKESLQRQTEALSGYDIGRFTGAKTEENAYKSDTSDLHETVRFGRFNIPSKKKSHSDEDFEVWVIERKPSGESAQVQEVISCKALHVEGENKLLLPIYETSVKAEINGLLAEVEVQQKYSNPYNKKIEIEYTFPLPENAAISDFVMVIGERKICGIIREKEEAKQIYKQALQGGYRAALMTQERENVFKQNIANVEPYKHIQINIQYFYNLQLKDGRYQFVFPTVVGPRYFPAQKGDANFNASSIAYTDKEIDHRVHLDVKIHGSKNLEKVVCKTHKMGIEHAEDGLVSILGTKLKPDKDIVIEIAPIDSGYASQMLLQKTTKGEFFGLSLIPSDSPDAAQMKGQQEIVFVLDCSGSMKGWPLERAKKMVAYSLKKLDSKDTFQIIQFSQTAKQFSRVPVLATTENKTLAEQFLESMNSSGGTEMIYGVKAALNYPSSDRERIIMFMTDGYIGNENDILKEIYRNIGSARIFSFGIGSSVNRYLLKEMAVAGRGGVAYIMADKDAKEEVGLFFDRLAKPLMKNIRIDWKDWVVADVYPKSISVLYHGMPKLITGKILKRGELKPEIIGVRTSEEMVTEINHINTSAAEKNSLEKIWARNQISMHSRALNSDGDQERPKKEILRISLDYQVLSQMTSFLAVDASGAVEDKSENIKVRSVSSLPENNK